jgi:hypothetical protein
MKDLSSIKDKNEVLNSTMLGVTTSIIVILGRERYRELLF